MSKSTVLVTGCAGFIGSHLTERLLQEGYSVIGIDNFDPFYDVAIKKENMKTALQHPDFTFLEADIRQSGFADSINIPVEGVFHLAAKAGVLPSLQNPLAYTETNIIGTQNVLEWMQRKGVNKLVFASSSSIYGNAATIPFTEDEQNLIPISPYAYTKKCGELLTHLYHQLHRINVVNLRFFTVYGERQRPDLAIHKFTKQILNNQPVTMYGNGETSRDYTYIDDIIEGVMSSWRYLALHETVYEIINLGNNAPVSLKNLIRELYNELGREMNVIKESMKTGDVDRTYAGISKASALLGYAPNTTFHDGLQRFVEWFKTSQNKGNPDSDQNQNA